MRFAAKLLATALLASTLVAAPALAQDINTPHSGGRPLQLDVHGGFTWWGYGAVAGARIGIPLVDNGFIDSLNNAFYLNFGADFYFVHCGCGGRNRHEPAFGLPVTAHWEFYFSETWSLFAELGINIYFHPEFLQGRSNFGRHGIGAWFIAAVGARLHINDWFGLVLRVGNPYVAFGMTFFLG